MKLKLFNQIALLFLLSFFLKIAKAQVAINSTGAAPSLNAMLDISSTNKGLLIPRMTTANRIALTATATDGLLLYDTNTQSFWYYSILFGWSPLDPTWIRNGNDINNNNTDNVKINMIGGTAKLDVKSVGSNTVKFNGGTGMFASFFEDNLNRGYIGSVSGNAEDFEIGTSVGNTNGSLNLSIQGSPKLLIAKTGNVGIGITNPFAKLDIVANQEAVAYFDGTAGAYIGILESGTIRGYIGSTAGNAQDFDLGIPFGGDATAKLHLTILGNPKLTVSNDGNVGIGITSPSVKLEVNSVAGEVAKFNGPAGMKTTFFESNIQRGHIGSTLGNSQDFDISAFAANSKLHLGIDAKSFVNLESTLGGVLGVFRPTSNGLTSLGTTSERWGGIYGTGLDITGFSKLGDDAATPKIKMKKITGTTPVASGTLAVVHGLTSSKILSVSIFVEYGSGANETVPPKYTTAAGFEYEYQIRVSDIFLINKSGNSTTIASRPFRMLITYEE